MPDFDGFQNAIASLDGFNQTSPESLAAYDACVLPVISTGTMFARQPMA
jgi:hypothetical protein